MTYRRAAIPALVGGLLLTALLWWAGASTQALRLPGSSGVFGGQGAVDLDRWLAPWSYDPPPGVQLGTEPGPGGGAGVTGARYLSLWSTAMQIRYGALAAFFVAGALFLLRRLPPVRGRTAAALLALWAWAMVVGTLAVTVSAPWLIAATGHGSYRFLPQLAAVSASGRQLPVLLGLFTAAVTVAVARITAKGGRPAAAGGRPGAGRPPRRHRRDGRGRAVPGGPLLPAGHRRPAERLPRRRTPLRTG